MRNILIPLLLASTCVAGAAPDDALEKALEKAVGKTHWYGLYLLGQKVGYARARTLATQVEGRDAVESQMDMRMKIVSLGQKQDVKVGQYRIYFRTGELHRLISRFTTDVTQMDMDGVVRDGKLHVTSRMGRLTDTKELPAPKETLRDMVAADRLVGPDAKIGDSVTMSQFDLTMMKDMECTLTLKERKKIVFGGVETPIHVIATHVPAQGVTLDSYVDAEGTPLEMSMGDSIVLRLETEKEAKNVTYSSDIVRMGCVLLDPHPKGVAKMRAATFRFQGIEDDALCIDGVRQTWTKGNDGSRTVVVSVAAVDAAKAATLPIPPKDFQEELSPTLFIQSRDARVQKLAKELIGAETNAWEAARKIRAWVDVNIQDVGTAAMSNAVETLDSKKGDCTEHTVLFVALARAAGIPARECAGLTAIDGGKGFYYHAWPEVWVGQWVAMDPTLGQDVADATHIALAHGSIADMGRVVGIIGKLKAKWIER